MHKNLTVTPLAITSYNDVVCLAINDLKICQSGSKRSACTARGSAGEVRSMVAVVRRRPALHDFSVELNTIKTLAESCSKQIGAWMMSIERSPVKGKRHRSPSTAKQRSPANKAEPESE